MASSKLVNYETAFRRTSTVYIDEKGKTLQRIIPHRSWGNFYAQLTKLSEDSLQFDIVFKDINLVNLKSLKCEAENIYGKTEKIVETVVGVKNLLKFVRGEESENLKAELNQIIGLDCEVESTIEPIIRWYFVSFPFSKLQMN